MGFPAARPDPATAGDAPPSGLAACALDVIDLAGPVQVAERSGRILYQNAALRTLLTESGEALLGTLEASIVARLAWSDTPIRLMRPFASGRRTRTFAVRYAPLARTTGDDLVAAYFEEVTQSADLLRNFKRHRDRSQEFLSIVSDWVWEVDADWKLLHTVGRQGESAYADLAGGDLLELGRFVDLPDHPVRRPPNRRTRAPFQDCPFRLNEGGRVMLLSAIPVFCDESGAFQGYRGSGRDVTAQCGASESARAYRQTLETTLEELRAANDRLDAALVDARSADRAKSSFLAMMSHELRTPLNAVIGFAELLEGETFGPLGSPRYIGYAGDILASGRNLLSLINDILNFVHVEAGAVQLRHETVDVADVLSRAVRLTVERARKDGVEVAVDCDPSLSFFCDEKSLLQILLNLLSNAVKFTNLGGAVHVTAGIDAAGLLVRVRDTGVGIAPEQLNHVLKPFQQADGRLERQFEGAGLGLPLAKALAALHKGDIALASILGEGTTVEVRLPHPARE